MDRRLARLLAASLTVGIALAAVPVAAGNDSWTVQGSPSGGGVGQVIVDPSTPTTLYATSGSGVYKSMDSGGDWTLIFKTLNGPNALALDPLSPSTLYVAYSGDFGQSLFKTTDGGANWTAINNGIGTIEGGEGPDFIGSLTVDPVNEGTVYATSYNTGVYKTTDGGAHWSPIDTGLSSLLSKSPNAFLWPIAVDPANPQVLYLPTQVTGTNGGAFADHAESGIYQSTDGGATWTQRIDHMGFEMVTVDPSNPDNVYAGGSNAYSSTDGGATWAPVSGWPVQEVISVDPNDSQHLWGMSWGSGVWESTDGGTDWTQTNLGGGIFSYSIAQDPVTPANLYIATNWGVFKSTDTGATWSLSTTGIHNVTVDEMIEGADGIIYIATAGNGIYKSADQGASWSQVGASSGPTGSLPTAGDFLYALVQDPTANGTLYAGGDGGLFKSVDGGDSWTESDTGIPAPPYVMGLAIDPQVPTTLYAATNNDGVGVYKSVDSGAHWTAAGNGLVMDPVYGGFIAVTVDPHNSNVVYAGAFHSGLFKSTDGGASWQQDNGAMGAGTAWGIAIDPNDSNVVYVASDNGFFKSTDAGATWVESDSGLGAFDLTTIKIDPADSSVIYVSQWYGVGDAYVSPDAGATWYDLSDLSGPSAQKASPKSVHKVSRAFAGRPVRSAAQGSGPTTWAITSAIMGKSHPDLMIGSSNDGQVYSFNVKDLPKVKNSGGGGTTPPPAKSSGGGGGSLSLLMLGLLGFAASRRKV